VASDLGSLMRLQKWHIKSASEILSQAFIDDLSLCHQIPDHHKREKLLPLLFRLTLRHGILSGEVYAVSHDMEGIVMWLPSEASDKTLWTMIRCGGLALLFKVDWGILREMKRDEDCVSALRKRLVPFSHWYLAVLGVAPKFQGAGYASKLLHPMLTRLDAANSPCYVETSTEEYVSLYEHFGFKVIDEVITPGSNTKMWAMLRR